MLAKIPLSKGFEAIVDASDLDLLSDKKWYYIGNGYAATSTKETRTHLLMHRLLMGAVKGDIVDHINGNTLDNRRSNLRFANASQNSYNCITKSKVRGVGKMGKSHKYNVRFNYEGHPILVYGFVTEAEALAFHDMLAFKLLGPYAITNSPNPETGISHADRRVVP